MESDNYQGQALDRLQVWNDLFSDRVHPFNLSHDAQVYEAEICGERIQLSHVLFKPNILVNLHVLRRGTTGSIFKNLLGLISDIRKGRFHAKLGVALVDLAEAVGWIDFSVIDGTYIYGREWKNGQPLDRERRNILVAGRDPVAVETVGSILASEDPNSIPSIVVAKRRRLGETDITRITILGKSIQILI